MTGDEFYKYHWKAMEVVEFVDYDGKIVQCVILGTTVQFYSEGRNSSTSEGERGRLFRM